MRRVRHPSLTLWGIGLLGSVLMGCSNENPPGSDPEPKVADVSKPFEEVPLAIASWEDTQAMIAGQRGKVVVVDLWTTW